MTLDIANETNVYKVDRKELSKSTEGFLLR